MAGNTIEPIKASRVGTFTAAATAHHMGVQEFASEVKSHPGDYSTKMKRKAVFAANSRKWKHR